MGVRNSKHTSEDPTLHTDGKGFVMGIPYVLDGVTYTQIRYRTFDELPDEVKTAVVSSIKKEIKDGFEKYTATTAGICYNTPSFRKAFIQNGFHYYIRQFSSREVELEIAEFCNTLFGPHVPYLMTPNYEILFVKNM